MKKSSIPFPTPLALCALLLATPLAAQPPAAETSGPTTPVKLDPFEVQADSDKSYGALNSNSITQFSARLDNLPGADHQ